MNFKSFFPQTGSDHLRTHLSSQVSPLFDISYMIYNGALIAYGLSGTRIASVIGNFYWGNYA